jgi:hypothetical protein
MKDPADTYTKDIFDDGLFVDVDKSITELWESPDFEMPDDMVVFVANPPQTV